MSWWHYLLLVNFYLLLFFAFYALLLRRETFFQLNRIYLVGGAILSFAIPVIQADWVKDLFITKQVQYTLYGGGAELMVYNIQQAEHSVTIGHLLTLIYITVTFILTLRLLWQLIVLKKQIEKPSPSAAYSFFKKISLGKDVAEHKAIARHEQVHATQWHSVDVMIIETVMIINWFNPVVYLYRFAIKYIHEYIADMQVISSGTDKADYALLLLSQTFHVPAHKLTNPFYSHSMLKKRILMLQKSKSQRIMLFKYCLSAPLFVLMMILSSATVNNSAAVTNIHDGVKEVMQAQVNDIANVITEHAEIPQDEVQVEFPPMVVAPDNPVQQYTTPYSNHPTYGAETDELLADKKVFVSVEQAPSFPGGVSAFSKFLEHNVRYPAQSRENNIQGKVYVSFIVEADGSLSDVQAVRGPAEDMKAEAVRVLNSSPKWDPGVQNGQTVRVQYTVPINFTLGDDDDIPPPGLNEMNKVLSSVEKYPSFPGGLKAFNKFLQKNLKYPNEMRLRGLQGKVFVTFVVGTNGQLSDIKAVRGPSEDFKDEAVRVLSSSPRWVPGIQNGRPVSVQYTVPINFTLSFDETQAAQQNNGLIDEAPPVITQKTVAGRPSTARLNNKPVLLVDGVVYDGSLNNLRADKISSIAVYKSPEAVPATGEKGKDAVVIINLKKD
ncbi:TonB family protein [Mucilaginibacter calamicampi]|uniref:TonB family protein n=1 Tax=Mucilaginibacter calamicampi TaxID=1302352 RepID=A0ABW2YWL9_9SPHI